MANCTIGASVAISSTTVTKPSGVVNGSVLVVRYHWFAAGGSAPPKPTMSDSFVDIGSISFHDTTVTYNFGVSFFRKVITNAAGEPATYTITPVTGRDVDLGQIDRLVNCDTTTPETDTGQNSNVSTTTQTTGAAVDAGAEDLVMLGVTCWTAPIATPATMVQDYLLDGGDIGGYSENPGALTGATRSSTVGVSGWANAWVTFKSAGGGGATTKVQSSMTLVGVQ